MNWVNSELMTTSHFLNKPSKFSLDHILLNYPCPCCQETFFSSVPVTVSAIIPQNYKDFMKINSGRAYKAGKNQVLQSGPFHCFTVTQDSCSDVWFLKKCPAVILTPFFPIKPCKMCNTPRHEKQRKFSELCITKNDAWLETRFSGIAANCGFP